MARIGINGYFWPRSEILKWYFSLKNLNIHPYELEQMKTKLMLQKHYRKYDLVFLGFAQNEQEDS